MTAFACAEAMRLDSSWLPDCPAVCVGVSAEVTLGSATRDGLRARLTGCGTAASEGAPTISFGTSPEAAAF